MSILTLPIIFLMSVIIEKFTCFYTQSIIYSISICIQQIIVFALPFYIFLSIYNAILKFSTDNIKFIFILILTIYFSNTLIILTSSFVGKYLLPSQTTNSYDQVKSLIILYKLPISKVFQNYTMIIFGSILSFYSHKNPFKILVYLFEKIQTFISQYLYIFINVMLLGIFINILHSNTFKIIINKFYYVTLLSIVLYFALIMLYVIIFILIDKNKISEILYNTIPPIIAGGPTMSSSLSIPDNIKSTTENTKNASYSNFIIPILTNTHTCGCGITISILNIITLFTLTGYIPTNYEILLFALYSGLLKFSATGLPAGGMILLYPALINIFNYSNEMLIFITSIYVLLDILATSGNILFNNLLALILYKSYNKNDEK